jgi:LmbE family N-acetylglucosaminyl deacetylase
VAQPVLFVAAHQDDIELSMSSAVRKMLEAGVSTYDIFTLVLTTGQNSAAHESDFPFLSTEEFVEARDDEHERGNRRLGVRRRNIEIPPVRPADGSLTTQAAYGMIADWLDDYPNGWVKTHSDLPIPGVRHADHVTCGAAAKMLLHDGAIIPNGLRFYVEPYQLAQFQQAYQNVNLGTETATATNVVKAALDEYAKHDTVGRYYGVGDASVHDAFVTVKANPMSYWHVPTP